jgi:hypothetical protein
VEDLGAALAILALNTSKSQYGKITKATKTEKRAEKNAKEDGF